MDTRLALDISRQPDDTTCGPTSLHAVYRYYGLDLTLDEVIAGVRALEFGGTLGVLLGLDALRRGCEATLYTYNLQVFDPSWFRPDTSALPGKLLEQRRHKKSKKLHAATDAYLEFLALGGRVLFEELSGALLRRFLDAGKPVLTGLSATYLYDTPREIDETNQYDDVRGEPSGHFVVLCGYARKARTVLVADPLQTNPVSPNQIYTVGIDRLLGAIFLGIVTYDANLLIVEKNGERTR